MESYVNPYLNNPQCCWKLIWPLHEFQQDCNLCPLWQLPSEPYCKRLPSIPSATYVQLPSSLTAAQKLSNAATVVFERFFSIIMQKYAKQPLAYSHPQGVKYRTHIRNCPYPHVWRTSMKASTVPSLWLHCRTFRSEHSVLISFLKYLLRLQGFPEGARCSTNTPCPGNLLLLASRLLV